MPLAAGVVHRLPGGSTPVATPKAWGAAALIETDNAGDAIAPQVAFDSSGNALAVWYQSDGTRKNIWARRYDVGTGLWGTAGLIETDNAGDAFRPQVAFDSSGNALAVWYQKDGTRKNIWANRYDVIAGWGGAQLIETRSGWGAYGPQLSFDGSGNAFAVWSQDDGSSLFAVWANRYVAGSGWGSAVQIETSVADTQSTQVAVDINGNALVVWEQDAPGPRFDIWANRYDAGTGLWGTAELIETDNAGFAQRPQLAFDGSGNALAVWEQGDGTRRNIWANRYVAGTGWGTAAMIETDNAGTAQWPQLAFDSSGNALVVWEQSDGIRKNIWANRYDFITGLWGTAELIETDNAGDARNAQVAFDSSGNALAVWEQSDGSFFNIWVNRYVAGTGWGSAALIETDNAGDARRPQVAFDGNDNALAVWYQYDGTRYNIWVNRFQ